MPGRLDEISRAIGAIETSVRAQDKRSDEDRDLANRRHNENQSAIGDLRQDTQRSMSELSQTATERWNHTTEVLNELRRDLLAHAAAVSSIQPQVAALQITRGRLIMLASIGLVAVSVIIEAAKAFLAATLAWAFKKFGGI